MSKSTEKLPHGNAMSFRQVDAFLAVATTLDFLTAASRVHMTRAGLVRVIRDLESQVGEALFERRSRGVELSAAGCVLLPYAQKLAAAYSDAMGNAMGDSQPTAQPEQVSLAGSSAILNLVLPGLLHRMPGAMGDTTLVLKDLASQQVVEEVHNGRADMGLCMTIEQTAQSLEVKPLVNAPVGLLASESMELSDAIQTIEDLEHLPYARLSSEMVLSQVLRRSDLRLAAYFESHIVCNSISALFSAVSQGKLVTLVSAVAASSDLAAGLRFIPLPNLFPSLQLSLVHDRINVPAHKWIDQVCASVLSVNWHPAAKLI